MTEDYKRPSPCGIGAERIAVLAEQLATKLNFQPGSDLEPIIEHLGGEITVLPIDERGSKWASITVEKGGKFTIKLPPLTFPLQQRMSMAHELGHLFLHSRRGEIALKAYRNAGEEENELAENEAHEFAYEFLVPSKSLREVMEFFGDDTIGLAAHFMVPEPVIRQRLKRMVNAAKQ